MTSKRSLLQRITAWLQLPHRWRLACLVLGLVLTLAARVTVALGGADWLDDALREQVSLALDAVAAVLGVGSADAWIVDVARRDPTRPAIRDDVRGES